MDIRFLILVPLWAELSGPVSTGTFLTTGNRPGSAAPPAFSLHASDNHAYTPPNAGLPTVLYHNRIGDISTFFPGDWNMPVHEEAG